MTVGVGNVGMNCVSNADCDTLDNTACTKAGKPFPCCTGAGAGTCPAGNGVCAGTVFGCPGALDPNCSSTNGENCQCSAPGAPGTKSCAQLESSNLSGWVIRGSFPALDGAGGIGDSVTYFTLACQ